MRARFLLFGLSLLGASTLAVASAPPADLPLPADVQQVALDGARWLLPHPTGTRDEASVTPAQVARLSTLLADPTVREAVRRRRALALGESLSTLDVRARLLFLHGPPQERQHVDCNAVFAPLEIWRYGRDRLVLYQPAAGAAFRLWLPIDGKRVVYTHEMAGWLEEWEALAGRVSGQRVDRRLCRLAPAVDAATGVDGMAGQLAVTPDASRLLALLDAPSNVAAWARAATAEPRPDAPPSASLPLTLAGVGFPRWHGERLEARVLLSLPADAPLAPYVESKPDGSELRELRIDVDGVVESGRTLLDTFRVRFVLPPRDAGDTRPLALVLARPLRPGSYVLRLRATDEVGHGRGVLSTVLEVPDEAQPAAFDVEGVEAQDASRRGGPPGGEAAQDALVLLVPPSEVLIDSVHVVAMVNGQRIRRVQFLLDGRPQIARSGPLYAVDLPLPHLPREQVLRAEGYDDAGKLVAADEAVINQLRGQLEVSIVDPPPRSRVEGATRARVQLVVPEERHVRFVELSVNEEVQARLEKPPWEATIRVPAGDLAYVTATAELDDGTRAEDVRFLGAPNAMAEVDVQLVELYTTVTDGHGELLRGLRPGDFIVTEDGRRQTLQKAELVEDLPLTVGIALDVSGSMQQELGQAQRAAADFLRHLVRPKDRCFAVAFADRPTLVMPRTADVEAATQALQGLRADGSTTLHDALVFGLYYFQGNKGRRALVVLSDGADTSSKLSFDEALAYARDSGVVIYTVGLQTEDLDTTARNHLARLAEATGGRAFVIHDASELAAVYARIEAELRSQYLLAYAPDKPAAGGDKRFRRVAVSVDRHGAVVRTIPGYTP